MQKIILILLLTIGLSAKIITPNDVYSQSMLIQDHVHFLLKHYGIKHHHNEIISRTRVDTKLKPRNAWQLTYEIMVKINIFRQEHKLLIIEPVNVSPILNLNSDLVYEQTQRILTELKIFEVRESIKVPKFKQKNYKDKTSIDIYNSLMHISKSFDELNKGIVTPSFVFGEQMRVYDDITLILQRLQISDETIPKAKKIGAVPEDVFDKCMKVLEKIKQLQIGVGIDFVDFTEFKKGDESASDVYTITQMTIAELQTIKAYLEIENITASASKYNTKTPAEVGQLVSWNFRKLNLIHSLNKGR